MAELKEIEQALGDYGSRSVVGRTIMRGSETVGMIQTPDAVQHGQKHHRKVAVLGSLVGISVFINVTQFWLYLEVLKICGVRQ